MLHLNLISSAIFSLGFTACASISTTDEAESVKTTITEYKGHPDHKKSIFVFLDGTANDVLSGTNVWRLYRQIEKSGDIQIAAKYIEGVGGTENSEFQSSVLLGMLLGQGMEIRIKSGYDFIAKNYKFGDDIYIFGFSRGAHEARSLAGFISYVGIPAPSEKSATFGIKEWNKILELAKSISDADFAQYWIQWVPGAQPPLAGEVKEKLGVEFRPVQIRMLGVWDTVPGSSFKKFGKCKEMPDGKNGDRYKTDSYPPIRAIAHAIAIDEKRDMFRPILICPATYPTEDKYKPKIIERWFPGAHADVGGGYADGDNFLPNISLNWMTDILGTYYAFPSTPQRYEESPNGLAHWSLGDMPNILGMKCEDRDTPHEKSLHPSVNQRMGKPPIRVKGSIKHFTYPILCKNEVDLLNAPGGTSSNR